MSSHIEQHRADYYALLQRIRTHGDWPAWIRYFLVAVRDTARSAIDQSQAILNLRDGFHAGIRGVLLNRRNNPSGDKKG